MHFFTTYKKTIYFTLAVILFSTMANAQDSRSPFRSGYTRIGINTLGKDLDNSLTPKQNVFDGRYGASTGFVFETGHIFYFQKSSAAKKWNYGLDWTILSLNYNKMSQWDAYGNASKYPNYAIDGTKIAAAVSTKLGPVVSFNPVEKLVIDARIQLIPVVRFFDVQYSDDGQNFYFTNEGRAETDENYNPSAVKNRLNFGVATGFGLTVRRQAFGLAIDYISGKVKANYDATDGAGDHTFGQEKIPAHNFQVKLSFSL